MTLWNVTAHGVTYPSPDAVPANLRWIDPKGHENFWCSVLGGTSGSSSSPRTEMREVEADGTPYNFDPMVGVHKLSGTVRTELAPTSLKVIIGQIHAYGAPNPFLMVSWWKNEIRIDARPTSDANTVTLARIPCSLSQARKYALEVNNGMLSWNLSGLMGSLGIDASWSQFPFYFKRGSYVIDNDGPAEEGGWVIYEEASTSHA